MQLLAIDFDGTIVEHAFPEIGKPLEDAFEVMKELEAARDPSGLLRYGLILWTCRENTKKRSYLDEAVSFCKDNGIIFRSVNENIPADDFREPVGRKIYAHRYIDDRNLNGFPGWKAVRAVLLG